MRWINTHSRYFTEECGRYFPSSHIATPLSAVPSRRDARWMPAYKHARRQSPINVTSPEVQLSALNSPPLCNHEAKLFGLRLCADDRFAPLPHLTRHDGSHLVAAESSVAGDSKSVETPGFGDPAAVCLCGYSRELWVIFVVGLVVDDTTQKPLHLQIHNAENGFRLRFVV